jgi:hypothetical protein
MSVRLPTLLRSNPAGIVAAYDQSAAIRPQIAMPDLPSRKDHYDAEKAKFTIPKKSVTDEPCCLDCVRENSGWQGTALP